MEFIQNIFVGNQVKDLSTIIYSLKRGIPVFQIYCICLFEVPNKRFEILSSRTLCSWHEKKRKCVIAGIASGKQEAQQVFFEMIQQGITEKKDIHNLEDMIR